MNVLILGANGFIGRGISEALLNAGHAVFAVARQNDAILPAVTYLPWESSAILNKNYWQGIFSRNNIHVVVNCLGILQGTEKQFKWIHFQIPQAVAHAIEDSKIRFIQISALGDESDLFIESKFEFDAWLADSVSDHLIIRPSVVMSTRGSYGGTSLIRALSALPFVLLLPGNGRQKLRPILLQDLCQSVVQYCQQETLSKRLVYAVGPNEIFFKQLLLGLRSWFGFKLYFTLSVPLFIIRIMAFIGQRLNSGPFNATTVNLLEQGNTVSDKYFDDFARSASIQPRCVLDELAVKSCFVQDRWHSRFYILRPVNIVLISAIWIVSSFAGFQYNSEQWYDILSPLSDSSNDQLLIVYGLSVLDLVLGFLIWFNKIRSAILYLMLVSVFGYSLVVGSILPQVWLEPLGGMIKNAGIISCLLMALILEKNK